MLFDAYSDCLTVSRTLSAPFVHARIVRRNIPDDGEGDEGRRRVEPSRATCDGGVYPKPLAKRLSPKVALLMFLA